MRRPLPAAAVLCGFAGLAHAADVRQALEEVKGDGNFDYQFSVIRATARMRFWFPGTRESRGPGSDAGPFPWRNLPILAELSPRVATDCCQSATQGGKCAETLTTALCFY